MYTTRIPADRSRSPQPLSADSDLRYERPSGALAEPFFAPVSLATVYPEAALMCAVLEDAFLCFQRQFEIESRSIQRAAQEAEEWFFSDDSHAPFSFVSVCDVLGLEPEFMRKGLKHRRQSRPGTPQRKMRRLAEVRPTPRFAA